jgi:hypothetical protein
MLIANKGEKTIAGFTISLIFVEIPFGILPNGSDHKSVSARYLNIFQKTIGKCSFTELFSIFDEQWTRETCT